MNRLFVAAMAVMASSAALAQTSAETSASPATDARGVPVVSAPATAPTGANAAVTVPDGGMVRVNPNQAAVFTPSAATGNMPACSATVTDRCLQTYAGRSGKRLAKSQAKRRSRR